MRWQTGGRESKNVEDRRSMAPKVMAGGIGAVIIAALVTLLSGGDLGSILSQLGGAAGPGAPSSGPMEVTAEEQAQADLVKKVLGSTEQVWEALFQQAGKRYPATTLVMFRQGVQTGCGSASSAVGPFYCPGDKKVYIDLAFFTDLDRRFKAPGDFAQAYVVAHEVGHHVQNVLGISDRVRSLETRARDEAEKNAWSVRLELQADFLAGVWAHHAQRMSGLVLEVGDLEEAIRCAQAIGDDALQMQARGQVRPDSFTHGSSAQRIAWFRHGFRSGDMSQGDTLDEDTWNRVNPR